MLRTSTLLKKRLVRVLSAAALAATLTLTVGCSQIEELASGITGGDKSTALSMLSKPAGNPMWSVEIQPAGTDGPLIVDETVVSYIVENGYLYLAGFDLQTGEKLWSRSAATGASTHLPLEVFTAEDGTPLIVKRNPPEADETNYFHHPVEIIEVATGEVRKTTGLEWWTAPLWFGECLVSTSICIYGVKEGVELQDLGLTENGVFTVNPNISVLPQFEMVLDANPDDDFIYGRGADGVNIGTYFRDGQSKWDIPVTELGLPEGITKREDANAFMGVSIVAQSFDEDEVVLVDATYRDLSGGKALQESVVSALDMKTGEILWSTPGELCARGVVCEGENYLQENPDDGSWGYLAGDFNLVGYDLRSGDKKWETATEAMVMYPDVPWRVVGDHYAILDVEGSRKLIDLDSGELIEITEEQSFGCLTDGPTFTHHRSSRPDLPLVEDTNNHVSQACGLNGESSDIASFSRNVVASTSNKPFGANPEWSVFDKQIRVVATADGIHAYKF